MSQLAHDPKELLNQGATRAKNMGVALVMICVLLTKYFVLKVVWKRLERVLAIVVVRSATVLSKLYAKAQPHIERFKARAVQTKNKAVRITLGLMIVVLTPVEQALLKFFGIAKQQSEVLAVHGTNRAISMIIPIFRAVGTALRAGFSRPAMQRMLARVLEIVDEAQKA